MSTIQEISWYDLRTDLPDWIRFPGEEWEVLSAQETGLDTDQFQDWIDRVAEQQPGPGGYGGDKPGSWGIAITRGGYLLHTFGDPHFQHQIASTGKLFTDFALIVAVDQGLVQSIDDPIHAYWSGEGELSHPHKYLDRGHHQQLTWRHLVEHTGGFPVTNGEWWKTGDYGLNIPAPSWAACTGDPDYDNYAHTAPGSVGLHYSSGGRWRLSQALTAVWKRDLKTVLDEFVLGPIGIAANEWGWLAGEDVRSNQRFYPELPAYATFCDPPYTLYGQRVRGGGGWVTMNALQLARVGLLMATGGVWKDERLLSRIPGMRRGQAIGHSGGGGNQLFAWQRVNDKDAYITYGQVTTKPESTLMPDLEGNTISGWIDSSPSFQTHA